MQRIKSLLLANRELVVYASIGVTGIAVDLCFFYILHSIVGINEYLANIISISLGITNNFFWNRQFNFKTKDRIFMRFSRFYSIGIFGLILSSIIIFSLNNLVGIDPTISKILSIPPVTILQFILNKRFSFHKF